MRELFTPLATPAEAIEITSWMPDVTEREAYAMDFFYSAIKDYRRELYGRDQFPAVVEMIFTVGMLQGIREERRRRKKSQEAPKSSL